MRLALSLARRGLGNASPNPAVGCVLARTDLFLDALQRECLGEHGLTFSEYSVLRLLQQASHVAKFSEHKLGLLKGVIRIQQVRIVVVIFGDGGQEFGLWFRGQGFDGRYGGAGKGGKGGGDQWMIFRIGLGLVFFLALFFRDGGLAGRV